MAIKVTFVIQKLRTKEFFTGEPDRWWSKNDSDAYPYFSEERLRADVAEFAECAENPFSEGGRYEIKKIFELNG